MAPKYTLTYFPLRERGEVIRMLFHMNGAAAEFEDKRISFEEFGQMKGSIELCPAGFLPMLTAPNGRILVQTAAIIRYVANEFGMNGSDNIDRAVIDSIIDSLKEIHDVTVQITFGTKEEDKPAAKVKFAEKIRKDLKYVEFRANENKNKDFLVGSKTSVVDVYLVDLFDAINACIGENNIIDDFPLLKNIDAKTREVPALKKYLATRK